MQARFLLGPAGSGKTFRCLAEIRAELVRAPEGPALLLLAPKQATFQLERQLLSDDSLVGYSRLQILSFERLAAQIATEMLPATGELLDEEGRVMVLRALLAQRRSELRVFHASARLPGFAKRLSVLLRELQRHQISPERLVAFAEKISGSAQLRDKLHDFSLLLRGYRDWLAARGIRDADGALDTATAILRSQRASTIVRAPFHLAGLWLDGFAEMTAQELDFLAAIIPHCEQATLAFCLEAEPEDTPAWLSTWSVVGQTFLRCRQRLEEISGVTVAVETLARDPRRSRFANCADFARLDANWAASDFARSPRPVETADRVCLQVENSLRLVACANPDAEATFAAREIRRFVRAGGRYREIAVLVRSLEHHANAIRRAFARYEIPGFIDRRESVAHHPLAELTRYALRTVAFGWKQTDWFGALKTGLVSPRTDEIDALENAALQFGWDGRTWLSPLKNPDEKFSLEAAERLRKRLVPPFLELSERVATPINGGELAAALRTFWNSLNVEKALEDWMASANDAALRHSRSALHTTVLRQMHAWLDNVERAFSTEALTAREWLPILEAGLATLTVGVIPPALDQVLIGAIDRSRNPELKFTLVLGLNEGVFPASPAEDPLLNHLERDVLMSHGARLGSDRWQRVGHEWFYGYIACTRASQQLALTCAQADAQGNKLNRSPFFERIEKIFPGLKMESWSAPAGLSDVQHRCEIIAPLVQLASAEAVMPAVANLEKLFASPQVAEVLATARQLAAFKKNLPLPTAMADALYGRELHTSVSALEDFASCPFKYFLGRGLQVQERKCFELDPRERGSFQHEVLNLFHNELRDENRRWRDVTPAEARERVRRIGQELLAEFREGLFQTDGTRRFAGELLLASLETIIEVLVHWARQCEFDPHLVEVGFGLPGSPWPGWRLDLGDNRALVLRGRIDRVDVWRDPVSGAGVVLVMDYKSSGRKPDATKLFHGLQLQLPAYLSTLEQLPEVCASLGVSSLEPAGVFYVNLRGDFSTAKSRDEALADSAEALRLAYQYTGRFDKKFIHRLDPQQTGEQFPISARTQGLESEHFRQLLERAVENLRQFGREIFSGRIAPDPYAKSSETACNFCDYAAVCRFDSWTQPFRVLKKPE